MAVAKALKWREFVVSFFIMAVAGSIPNLFVDTIAAIKGLPLLAFGDIVGGNVVDFTLVIGLAGLVALNGINTKSKTVQSTLLFTIFVAVLPFFFLIGGGSFTRLDGIALILIFFAYAWWLFSKKEHFTKIYDGEDEKQTTKQIVINTVKVVGGIAFLLASAQGIVMSGQYFSERLNVPLALVGALIIGLGNALPETYFCFASAKKNETWLILGDIMGSIILSATLVLGIVILINPFTITDFTPFAIARFFLILSAILFLIFVRSGKKISRKESAILFSLYIIFLLAEIFLK